MNALLEFLRARLNEDEAYARGAFGDHNDAGHWYEQWSGALNVGEDEDLVLTTDAAVSRFMERHDPERVLAEVAAKREIVRQADLYLCDSGPGCGYRTKHGHGVLRLLALPYAGHPDYREEWKP